MGPYLSQYIGRISGAWTFFFCNTVLSIAYSYSSSPLKSAFLMMNSLRQRGNFVCFFFHQQGMGYNFDFKISYKFIRKDDAIVRYGNSTIGTYRGNLVASTYCDRILEHCDSRQCRIQSPNYPGIYPRNVTCYYRVEVRGENSRGKPLIAVGQRIAQKIHIKDHHDPNRDERRRSLR